MDYEIKYNKSPNFKITITSVGELRIKVPIGTSQDIEDYWIERCIKITEYFLVNPYECTLRGRSHNGEYQESFSLQCGNKKNIFYVIGTNIEEHKNKEDK